MEVGALHQVAQSFGFKRRKARVTYLPAVGQQTATLDEQKNVAMCHYRHVCNRYFKSNLRVGLKVTIIDGLDQLLSDFDDFLLPG